MRLIDADALMKDLAKWIKEVDPEHPPEVPPMENIIVSTLMTIEEQPTVEEQKTGQWIVSENPDEGWKNLKCPFCEKTMSYYIHTEARPNFCINCGARMEE